MDIQLEKKTGFQLKHFAYGLIGICVLFLGWKWLSMETGSSFKVEKERLIISEVIAGKFDDYITITGTVAPIATIFMDAYEGGRVVEKIVEEGAMVKKDDIILKLENQGLYERILDSENNLALKQNDLRSTRLAFEAREIEGRKNLAQAEYELIQHKRAYEQNKALFEDELVSGEVYLQAKERYELTQKQYEIAKLQREQDDKLRHTTLIELEADLERMRRTLSMVYERIDHLNVRATADGQLGFLDAEIGQNISAGERIGQINVLTDFKIEADIDEHYIDRVQRSLSAILDREGGTYTLRVRKIYPEVRDGRFRVDLVFEGEMPEKIRTGQSYKLKLKLGESREALLLSRGGFYQSSGGQYVYVLNETGASATRQGILIGKQNTQYFEILEGLQPGDRVITSSYDLFGETAKVSLTE